MNADSPYEPPAEAQDVPTPAPDIVSRTLGDEVVLVNLRTNRIFALNPTGARFWELLGEGTDRTTIESKLQAEYGVSAEVVVSEIDALLTELRREGIVEDLKTE